MAFQRHPRAICWFSGQHVFGRVRYTPPRTYPVCAHSQVDLSRVLVGLEGLSDTYDVAGQSAASLRRGGRVLTENWIGRSLRNGRPDGDGTNDSRKLSPESLTLRDS